MVQNSNAAGRQTTSWLWIQGSRFLSKRTTKAALLQKKICGLLYPHSYHRQRLCKATSSLCVPLGCRACPFRGPLVLCLFPSSGLEHGVLSKSLSTDHALIWCGQRLLRPKTWWFPPALWRSTSGDPQMLSGLLSFFCYRNLKAQWDRSIIIGMTSFCSQNTT